MTAATIAPDTDAAVRTYPVIARLVRLSQRLDADGRAVCLSAANALVEAARREAAWADALSWGDEIAEMCSNVARCDGKE